MHCSNCGNALSEEAKFCSQCGRATATGNPPADGRQPAAITQTTQTGPVIQPARRFSGVGLIVAALLLALIGYGAWSLSSDFGGLSRTDMPVSDGNTDCYSLTLPPGATAKKLKADLADEPSNCNLEISYSQQCACGLRIQNIIGRGYTLQHHIDIRKKAMADYADTFVSEQKVTIDGYEGHEIVHRYGPYSGYQAITLVHTQGKHTVDGSVVDGFEIITNYAQPTEKQAADTILASWQWK